MAMALREFRALNKNSLRGFATVELPSGLVIRDISMHTSNGRSWAALPAKPQFDKDGSPRLKDGKPQYVAIVLWKDRDLADRFSEALVELVTASNPGALD